MLDLNRVRARGKWYVYDRNTRQQIVGGFSGTRVELDAHLATLPLKELEPAATRADPDGWRRDAAKGLHKVTLRRALRRYQEYKFDAESIFQHLKRINDRCEVSGMAFDYREKQAGIVWHRRPLAPSIDRKDNAFGYTPENVRIVCTCVNISINEWGIDLFTEMCQAVTKNVLQK